MPVSASLFKVAPSIQAPLSVTTIIIFILPDNANVKREASDKRLVIKYKEICR